MVKNVFIAIGVTILCVALIVGLCLLCACIVPGEDAYAMTVTMDDTGIVGDNLMPNVDFTSSTWTLRGTDYRSQGLTYGGWYFNYTDTLYNDAVITHRTPAGYSHVATLLVNNSSARANLHYDLEPAFLQSNTTYTLTFGLDVISSPWFGIAIEKRNQNTYGASLGGRSWSTFSSGLATYSLTLTTGTIDPTFVYSIALKVDPDSEIVCSFVKLETSSSFTGYVPKDYSNYGYDQGYDDRLESYYKENYGFTNYEKYFDFRVSDSYINYFRASDSGIVDYSSSNGAVFLPDLNASFTTFSFFDSSYAINTNNVNRVFALAYDGTFNEGDIVLNLNYSYYTQESSSPPWNGYDPVNTSLTVNLVPNQRVFVYVFDKIRDYPSWSLSVASTVSNFSVRAFLIQQGKTFYRFPVGGSDSASYNNGFASGEASGYSSGLTVGYDQGFEEGTASGYSDGVTAGYNTGYHDGLTVSSSGTFTALVSALVDTPIRYFRSLLNFDILGFNFFNVLRFVFTFCLFFFIIRLLVKGKVS